MIRLNPPIKSIFSKRLTLLDAHQVNYGTKISGTSSQKDTLRKYQNAMKEVEALINELEKAEKENETLAEEIK